MKFLNGQNDPVVGKPKADSCGTVRLSSLLAERVQPYSGKPMEYVIPFSREEADKPVTRSMFTKMWYRIKKKINLKGTTSHSFRASYASMITAHCENVDPKVLQSLLRHKTPDLAMKVYAKKNQRKTDQTEYEYEMYLCSALEEATEQKRNTAAKPQTA